MIFHVVLCAALRSPPYWEDPRIHNMGNGRLQAAMAPFATKLIDVLSYDSIDVRKKVGDTYVREGDTVCDLCCGTGFSTRDLGVDTSAAMIEKAREIHPDKTFIVANAETFGEPNQYDVVTVMFALHEVPRASRITILKNAVRICKSKVVVCDISKKKQASRAMLSGEPYLLEYQKHIQEDLADVYEEEDEILFWSFNDSFIPEHVMVSVLEKIEGNTSTK